ncbi:MAG: hypothetical protein ACU85U_03490 [Gammaproteobacteria bacterium]|jgi:hypothetical protein
MEQPVTEKPARKFPLLAASLAVLAVCGFLQPLVAAECRPPRVVHGDDMNAAVSLAIEVTEDGAIEGTVRNNSGRKIGDVEVLVEYAWIWARDFNVPDETPGWSTTYALPV